MPRRAVECGSVRLLVHAALFIAVVALNTAHVPTQTTAPTYGVYDIGTVLLQEQRFGAAAEQFASALAIRPDWPEAHNNLGIALASQGRIAEALPHFERAVTLKPDFDQARANRDQARASIRGRAQ